MDTCPTEVFVIWKPIIMNIRKAILLAIKAIRKDIRRIAVDANFHDKYCADYPHAVQASKDRKKYKAHAV